MMKNSTAGVRLGAPSREAPQLSPGLASLVKVSRPVPTPTAVPATLGTAQPMASPIFNVRAAGYAEGGMVTPNGPVAGGMPMQQGPQLGAPAPAQPPMAMNQLKGQLEQFMRSQPQAVQKVKEAIQTAISSGAMTEEDLKMAVQMAIAAAQNPELWPRLRQLAIQRGLGTEEEIPQQYDQGLVFALMLAGAAIEQEGGAAGSSPPAQAPQAQPAPANMAMGGKVPVSASPSRDKSGVADDIPIKVSAGEYVIPKHIVEQKGTDFFDKLIGKDIKNT